MEREGETEMSVTPQAPGDGGLKGSHVEAAASVKLGEPRGCFIVDENESSLAPPFS